MTCPVFFFNRTPKFLRNVTTELSLSSLFWHLRNSPNFEHTIKAQYFRAATYWSRHACSLSSWSWNTPWFCRNLLSIVGRWPENTWSTQQNMKNSLHSCLDSRFPPAQQRWSHAPPAVAVAGSDLLTRLPLVKWRETSRCWRWAWKENALPSFPLTSVSLSASTERPEKLLVCQPTLQEHHRIWFWRKRAPTPTRDWVPQWQPMKNSPVHPPCSCRCAGAVHKKS